MTWEHNLGAPWERGHLVPGQDRKLKEDRLQTEYANGQFALRGSGGHVGFANIKVGGNLLHVIVIFKNFHQF